MPYVGTLAKDVPFTFEAGTTSILATTWYWLKPGRIIDIQGLVSREPDVGPIEVRSPQQADRLVIEASAVQNTSAVVRLRQGNTTIDVGVNPDGIIQIDLV
jgi:hypothetical protein